MAKHALRDAQGRFRKATPKEKRLAGMWVHKASKGNEKVHAGRYVHDEAYDEDQHDMGPWIEFPKSSRVRSVRYDYQNEAVQVRWKRNGAPYIYLDVPYERFRSFLMADSQGKYINSAMNTFDYRPATPDELDAPSDEKYSTNLRDYA